MNDETDADRMPTGPLAPHPQGDQRPEAGSAATGDGPAAGERRHWLDEPRNVDRLAYALYGLCALLVAIDLFVPKHGPFVIEHVFGFFAIFGFAAYVVLVLAAWVLRRLVMRPEDYYDR